MAATRYQQGCVEVIQLDERLTIDETELVQPLMTQATRHRLPQLIVDCRRLLLIDSAGLGLLLDVANQCQAKGGQLRVAGASALIMDVMRITGLDQFLPLDRDVVAAAGAYAR